MSRKRKQPTRLVNGDLDSSEFVSRRRTRQIGKNGKTIVRMEEEAVYDTPPDIQQDIPMPQSSFDASVDSLGYQDNEAPGQSNEDPLVARKPTKRQRDYIQQFVDRIDSILDAMMSRECLKEAEWKCQQCNQDRWASWRCTDCLPAEPMCRGCMRSTHLTSAVHRIEQWNGTYYQPTGLWAVGVYILVRHREGDSVCETLKFYQERLAISEAEADEQEQEELHILFSSRTIPVVPPNESFRSQNPDDEEVADETYLDAEAKSNAEFDALLETLQENPSAEILEPDDEEELVDEEIMTEPIRPYLSVPSDSMFDTTYVRVFHTNGMHQLGLISCNCRGDGCIPLDLIALQLIPTSFERIRTLFTGPLLDAFRLSSLELKASAYQFYRLLRRYTDPMAPWSIPNLYNEFRRMTRLWRWTKKLKWAGFAGHNHRSAIDVKPTELANFCPACPQIGINVADDWEADPNRFVYRRIFVADGNFKADHVRPKKPSRDVWLSEGGGFVPLRKEYFDFLKSAMETSTKAPCETTFRAITNSLLASKACDVTGVVGIACARHGCYAPNALCDLFRGEQQKNVDFALLAAIFGTNVHPNQGVMVLYDIICQYIIYLYRRIGHRLPEDLSVIPGIGMFHVHAHQDECFFRYAPSLIPGAGCVCGEILESLWAALNTISPTVRTATLAHRAKMLDDHTSNSNQKKLLGMVQFLTNQYFNAQKNKVHYNDIFDRLNARTNPTHLHRWQAQIDDAESQRLTNPSALDIYGADLSLTNNSTVVVEEEQGPATPVDLWIRLALIVEEKQIEIRRKLRNYGKALTPSEQAELTSLRNVLVTLVTEMMSLQNTAQVEDVTARVVPDPVVHLDWEDEDTEDNNHGPDEPETPTRSAPPETFIGPANIESQHLPLPSYNTVDQQYRDAEIKARIQQANRHLSALRDLIVSKAFQYADVLRQAPRKSVKTRSRKAVYDITQAIMYHTQIYSECRSRLQNLRPNPEIFEYFRELVKDDVRTSTAIIDPNSAGSTTIKLSWIWHSVTRRLDPFLRAEVNLDPHHPSEQPNENTNTDAGNVTNTDQPRYESPAMVEYKRVHWLRARAQAMRWDEELTYVTYEMQWTVKYFQSKSMWWKETISSSDTVGTPLSPGQTAYAERQSALWWRMMTTADTDFRNVNPNYVKL